MRNFSSDEVMPTIDEWIKTKDEKFFLKSSDPLISRNEECIKLRGLPSKLS